MSVPRSPPKGQLAAPQTDVEPGGCRPSLLPTPLEVVCSSSTSTAQSDSGQDKQIQHQPPKKMSRQSFSLQQSGQPIASLSRSLTANEPALLPQQDPQPPQEDQSAIVPYLDLHTLQRELDVTWNNLRLYSDSITHNLNNIQKSLDLFMNQTGSSNAGQTVTQVENLTSTTESPVAPSCFQSTSQCEGQHIWPGGLAPMSSSSTAWSKSSSMHMSALPHRSTSHGLPVSTTDMATPTGYNGKFGDQERTGKAMESENRESAGTTNESRSQDDDEFWTNYLDLAHLKDERVIDDWAKIVDVFLVYIALFTSVITAFCLDSTHSFQPDPNKVTNQILIAIYKETMNKTNPIDFSKYLTWDQTAQKIVFYKNLLLYMSLAIAITIAALAAVSRIWILRYGRKLKCPPPGPPRLHAMKRQEIYDGSQLWKLGAFIEMLPILTMLDVFLFGLFVLNSIGDLNIGFIVTNVFQVGLCYLLVASFSGAFIPNAPFRSSYSKFVKVVFDIIPNYRLHLMGRQVIHLRSIGIILFAMLALSGIGYLVPYTNPDYVALLYVPTAAIFALMGKGEKKDIKRQFNLPICLVAFVVIIYGIYCIAVLQYSYPWKFYIVFVIGCIAFGILGSIAIKMSRVIPSSTAVNAVAWMLGTCPSPKAIWFRKAVEVAGTSQYAQAELLERLLPLADPLIIQILEDGVHGITPLQREYLNCLEQLKNNLEPREGNFLSNEAPIPSKSLRRKLEELTDVECPPVIVENGNSRHVVQDSDSNCPLCFIRLLATEALKKFNRGLAIGGPSQSERGVDMHMAVA